MWCYENDLFIWKKCLVYYVYLKNFCEMVLVINFYYYR